jgi:hypothetical protein
MLFDLYLLRRALVDEQPSTNQCNLIRHSIRRLRESLIAEQTTTAAKPETSEVSRQLALSELLNGDDQEPF